jgi:transcriptional regulator with XRE-family HTH domain
VKTFIPHTEVDNMPRKPQLDLLTPEQKHSKDYLQQLLWKWRGEDLSNRAETQDRELAEMMGIGRPTLSNWLAGRRIPGAESVKILADFFKIDYKEAFEAFGHEYEPPITFEYIYQYAKESIATEPDIWIQAELNLKYLKKYLDAQWLEEHHSAWKKIQDTIMSGKETLREKALMLAALAEIYEVTQGRQTHLLLASNQ